MLLCSREQARSWISRRCRTTTTPRVAGEAQPNISIVMYPMRPTCIPTACQCTAHLNSTFPFPSSVLSWGAAAAVCLLSSFPSCKRFVLEVETFPAGLSNAVAGCNGCWRRVCGRRRRLVELGDAGSRRERSAGTVRVSGEFENMWFTSFIVLEVGRPVNCETCCNAKPCANTCGAAVQLLCTRTARVSTRTCTTYQCSSILMYAVPGAY